MNLRIFDIDLNDHRFPKANLKGEGFIMVRGFLDGVEDARREHRQFLQTTRLKSNLAKYRLADKKLNKNKYYRIMNGIKALAMYACYMEHDHKLHIDLLERRIENGLFHIEFEDAVFEMILHCNNLKIPTYKKLFYKT